MATTYLEGPAGTAPWDAFNEAEEWFGSTGHAGPSGLDLLETLSFEVGEVDPEIVGVDTRKVIRNTRRAPFRFICRISMGCTGTLVAPDRVLTSAHCIYDRASKKETWSGRWVAPGRNGRGNDRKAIPYGRARIQAVRYPSAYASAKSYGDAWPFDYAVLRLDWRLTVPGTAFSRLRALPPALLTRVKLNTAGYPAGGSQRQYWTYNSVTKVDGARVRHVLDTKPGQSGSPIWLRWREVRSIVAIHKAGFTGDPQQNRAVALTPENLARIQAWIRE